MDSRGTTLSIARSVKHEELESLSALLEESPRQYLDLPERLADSGSLGLEARVIHLIVQWARTTDTPTLVLPLEATDAVAHLRRLSQTAFGVAAVALAAKVVTHDGAVVPARDVRPIANQGLRGFQRNPTNELFLSEEGYSALAAYGHPDEYDPWLFPEDYTPEVRGKAAERLGFWFEDVYSRILPKQFASWLDPDRRSHLAAATFELLENTYLHGRRNEFAEPLPIGVRGLSIRLVQVPFDAKGMYGGHGDVTLYFINRFLKDVSGDRHFIEVTVLDSGIGYSRWINAPCNDSPDVRQHRGKSEAETVLACLLKHATSKTADGSGVGLFRVTRVLKALYGFIRIRTGRTCYYARLDQTPDGKQRPMGNYRGLDDPAIDLREWFPKRSLPEAHGTSVTLCIPLTQFRKTS
jgi:hypothetical protein